MVRSVQITKKAATDFTVTYYLFKTSCLKQMVSNGWPATACLNARELFS